MNRQLKNVEAKEENTVEQYLSFIMDSEEYAVGILSVREIKGWEKVTQIPNTPDYVKGFINLREFPENTIKAGNKGLIVWFRDVYF